MPSTTNLSKRSFFTIICVFFLRMIIFFVIFLLSNGRTISSFLYYHFFNWYCMKLVEFYCYRLTDHKAFNNNWDDRKFTIFRKEHSSCTLQASDFSANQLQLKVKDNNDFSARVLPHLGCWQLLHLLCYIFLLCDVLMNAYIWVQIWQISGVNHPWGIERCSFVKLNLFLVANGVFVQVTTSIFFFDGKSSFVAAHCFGKRIKQKQNKAKKEKENNNQTIEFIKFSSNGGLSLFWTF